MLLYLYVIFILFDVIAMIIAASAEYNVKSKFNKYSTIASDKNYTGRAVAERILAENDITNISVNRINGTMTDHYNHGKKALNLSGDVYSGNSIASIAIAAHEAGHAIQYKKGYFGIKVRNFIIPVSNFISRALIPLILIGMLLTLTTITFLGTNIGDIIIIASLISLSLSVIVNLVTLPVEFDASKRALKCIEEMNIVDEDEYDGTAEMLKAAALTYVASLAISLIYLFRYIIIILSLRGNNK